MKEKVINTINKLTSTSRYESTAMNPYQCRSLWTSTNWVIQTDGNSIKRSRFYLTHRIITDSKRVNTFNITDIQSQIVGNCQDIYNTAQFLTLYEGCSKSFASWHVGL